MDPRLYKSPDSFVAMSEFYDRCLEDYRGNARSEYVETRFGRTHLLVGGVKENPPLILIQGMAGSAVLWHHQWEEFSRHFRIYALDVVGQPGRSDPVVPSLLNHDYAYWMEDVMDGLNLRKAFMMGISSAGWGILMFGTLYPERVEKAVLLSPLKLSRGKLNGRKWVRTGMKRDTAEDRLEDRLSVRDFSPPSEGRRYDPKLARAMALATRHYRLAAAMGIDPVWEKWRKIVQGIRVITFMMTPVGKRRLRRYTVPSLVVMGEHEALYNQERAGRRIRSLKNLRVEIIRDAGHAAVFDRPEVINPIIIDFLIH